MSVDPRGGLDPRVAGSTADSRSLGDMLGEITKDISTLMRQEVELAKAEIAQSAKKAGKGAGMGGGAAVAGHMALVFLSVALWWALGDQIGHGLSAVIVAVVWGIIAAVLAMRAKAEVQKINGAPQTADTVKKIPNALQGHEERNA
jgi:hypothetical protein